MAVWESLLQNKSENEVHRLNSMALLRLDRLVLQQWLFQCRWAPYGQCRICHSSMRNDWILNRAQAIQGELLYISHWGEACSLPLSPPSFSLSLPPIPSRFTASIALLLSSAIQPSHWCFFSLHVHNFAEQQPQALIAYLRTQWAVIEMWSMALIVYFLHSATIKKSC